MTRLTARQTKVLEFVRDYIERIGYPPSLREIGTHFEIGSLRGVTVHLDALERKGYLERSNTPRSIRITHKDFKPRNAQGSGSVYRDGIPKELGFYWLVRGIQSPQVVRIVGDDSVRHIWQAGNGYQLTHEPFDVFYGPLTFVEADYR